jgi:hypothetical protein
MHNRTRSLQYLKPFAVDAPAFPAAPASVSCTVRTKSRTGCMMAPAIPHDPAPFRARRFDFAIGR